MTVVRVAAGRSLLLLLLLLMLLLLLLLLLLRRRRRSLLHWRHRRGRNLIAYGVSLGPVRGPAACAVNPGKLHAHAARAGATREVRLVELQGDVHVRVGPAFDAPEALPVGVCAGHVAVLLKVVLEVLPASLRGQAGHDDPVVARDPNDGPQRFEVLTRERRHQDRRHVLREPHIRLGSIRGAGIRLQRDRY